MVCILNKNIKLKKYVYIALNADNTTYLLPVGCSLSKIEVARKFKTRPV